jgi:copper transport protein
MRFIVAALLGACVLAGPGEVRAHAVLIETAPSDGEQLVEPPSEIVLRFNDPVAPIAVRVLDGEGQSVIAPGAVETHDTTLRIRLDEPLGRGAYVVSYRVASQDAHAVAGSFVFAVGDAPVPRTEPLDAGADEESRRIAAAAVRAATYALLLGTAGGALFLGLVGAGPAAPAIRRGLAVAAPIAAAAVVLGLGIKGAELADVDDLFDSGAWLIGVRSTFGTAAFVALAGLAIVGAGLAVRRHGNAVLLAGGVVAAGSFALTGHAATIEPRWAGATFALAHTIPIAFWIGSLWPLHEVMRTAGDGAADIVRRSSRLAVLMVAILGVAGLSMAAALVQTPEALITRDYGRTLLVKLAAVALLLALASWNKWRLTPTLAAGAASARRRLARSIRAELALAATILCVTAVLSATPPQPQLHARPVAQAEVAVWIRAQGRGALVQLAPARAGRNALNVYLVDAAGRPLRATQVTAHLSHRGAGIAPLVRTLAAVEPGLYALPALDLPVAGAWRIRIEALITDFEKANFAAELAVR